MENNAVEIDFGQELGERQIRRVYLITYSQVDMKKMASFHRETKRIIRPIQNTGRASWKTIKMGESMTT